jgi:hypothetical protein
VGRCFLIQDRTNKDDFLVRLILGSVYDERNDKTHYKVAGWSLQGFKFIAVSPHVVYWWSEMTEKDPDHFKYL